MIIFFWLLIDGDPGASYWNNVLNYEDAINLPISLLDDPFIYDKGIYQLKQIEYFGTNVHILLQNDNGPCPFIAISNILSLRGSISLLDGANNQQRIQVKTVVEKIMQYLSTQNLNATPAECDKIQESLLGLQFGLTINCRFNSCNSLTSNELSLFEMLKIRMVHGWLIDPQFPLAEVIGNFSHDELGEKLVQNAGHFTPDEKNQVNNFLNSAQLTPYGLAQLSTNIVERELVVFFRNNHFSTMMVHNGVLLNLVTDIGYEKERLVVWDLLSDDGNSTYLTSNFENTSTVKREELRNTALAFGFDNSQVEEALASSANEDDMLAFLNRYYVPN